MQKKGISGIIVAILMILIVVLGTGMVWVVIQNMLDKGTSEIESGLSSSVILKVQEVSPVYSETNPQDLESIEVIVSRDIGKGDLQKIKFLFYDSSGESLSKEKESVIGELGKETFTFDAISFSINEIEKVAVAPIVLSNNQEKIKDITDTYKLSSAIGLSSP